MEIWESLGLVMHLITHHPVAPSLVTFSLSIYDIHILLPSSS